MRRPRDQHWTDLLEAPEMEADALGGYGEIRLRGAKLGPAAHSRPTGLARAHQAGFSAALGSEVEACQPLAGRGRGISHALRRHTQAALNHDCPLASPGGCVSQTAYGG